MQPVGDALDGMKPILSSGPAHQHAALVGSASLPLPGGSARADVVEVRAGVQHLVLRPRARSAGKPLVVVRECLRSQVFGDDRCGCSAALQSAVAEVESGELGALVLLRSENDAPELIRCPTDGSADLDETMHPHVRIVLDALEAAS